MNDYKKLLNMLIDNISYIYYKTDGTYGDLHPLVADSVKYAKEQLTPNDIDAKCVCTMKEEAYHNCFAPQPYTDRQLDYDYVDLGLPSGTLWATCNVGAKKPEEYGEYYTWDWTKMLDCTLPTKEQFKELVENCKTEWIEQGDTKGRLFIGPNGNTLFFPAAGNYNEGNLYYAGHLGSYWSSSLSTVYPSGAYYLTFDVDNVVWYDGCDRYYGRSVRAVKNKEE